MAFTVPDSALAPYPDQARVQQTDFDILVAGYGGTGVSSGCAVSQRGAGANMSVDVASGVIFAAGSTVSVASANKAIGANSSGNPRIDLVYATNAGVLTVLAGTPGASPKAPALPANAIGLAFVYVPDSAASILNDNIVDKRCILIGVAGGGGGGGDISSTDTDASGWAFVESSLTGSTTKLPTDSAVQTALDALTTFTTSDTGKVPVITVNGVTVLDVTNLLSTSSPLSFSDSTFTIQSATEPTAMIAFDASAITAGATRILSAPNTDGVLVLAVATQTLRNKTYEAPLLRSNVTAVGVTIAGYAQTLYNDGSRSTLVEIFGSSQTGAHISFITNSGVDATPSQTLINAIEGRLSTRGYTDTGVITSGATTQIQLGVATEAVTVGARGALIKILTTPTGGTTLTEAVRIDAATIPGMVVRGSIAIGAGGGMASAASGLAIDIAAGAGLIGWPVAALTLANGDNNNVTLPTSPVVVVSGPTGAFAITGIVAPATGKGFIIIINRTGQTMTLKDENASSTAANRILTLQGVDQGTTGDGAVLLVYDNVSANPRWIKAAIAT